MDVVLKSSQCLIEFFLFVFALQQNWSLTLLWISDVEKREQSRLVSSCKLEKLWLASKAFLVCVTVTNWPLIFWNGLDCFLSIISVVIKNLISTIHVWQREKERERKFLSFSVKHWSTIHLFLGKEWLILKGYQMDIIGRFWR